MQNFNKRPGIMCPFLIDSRNRLVKNSKETTGETLSSRDYLMGKFKRKRRKVMQKVLTTPVITMKLMNIAAISPG